MTNPLADTSNFLAQTPVQFNIGQQAAGKLPFITSGNNTKEAYQSNFGGILSGLMSFAMLIAVLLVLLNLIWGAIQWIASGGDKGKIESARNKITQSVIGIIILAATTGLFMMMQQFVGINVISFGGSNQATQPTQPQYICLPRQECNLIPGTIADRGNCSGCTSPNICCRSAE